MARDYPPLSKRKALDAAAACARTWHGPPQSFTVNYGNQDTEYILATEASEIKRMWRESPSLYGYERVAGDSDSGNGTEIDLKLRAPGSDVSAFNYHLKLDTQAIKVEGGPTKKERADARAEQDAKMAAWKKQVQELERQARQKADAKKKAAKAGKR